MSDDQRGSKELRERAEARMATPARRIEELGPEELARLVHELEVHQVELELQNEALRLAQQALETSRARYFELFDLAPVAYFAVAEEGLVEEANLTAAALLGVHRQNLTGRPLTRWIHLEDQDLYYQHRRELLETGKPQACELRMARSDGLVLWVWLESTLERDEQGRFLCRTTVSNISERKTLQARLAGSDRLASLGLIAAGVSHELTNPLTSLLYNLECLARERPDPEEARGLAREALEAAVRIKKLARVLGGFSRVDPSRPSPIDLRDPIEHALAMAAHWIEARARLVRDYGQVPPVLASAGRLAQVFLNLLLNAAQAIAEGAPGEHVIRVRTAVEGAEVLAEVSDTGVGIAEAHRDKVFDPFFTTREIGQGSGLGLSVARSVIEELGGRIELESTVGKGTRVLVRLPAAPAEDARRDARGGVDPGRGGGAGEPRA